MTPEKPPAKTNVPGKGYSRREAVAAALAAAAESIVVLLSFSKDVPLPVPMQLHVITVAVVGLILFRDRSEHDDLTVASMMFLAIIAAGPAGAIASLSALAFVDHAGAGPSLLQSWYTRLSRASGSRASAELADRVIAGRVINWTAPAPEKFEDVIATGSLEEKQAALGLMARRFHTDFAPALELALRSPEPIVRVQAAAVVARVRADIKTRIKTLLTASDNRLPAARVINAGELVRLAGCSLVDRADADKCRKAAAEALRVVLVTGQDVAFMSAAADLETAPMIERYLVSSGRYREFRVARRIHSLTLHCAYRVRPISRPIKRSLAA